MNDFIKTSVVVLVITAIVFAAGVYLGKQLIAVGSPAGSTFGDAKTAYAVFNPTTASATSTSILNTDGSDRKITSFKYDCSGVGTSLTAYTGAGLLALQFTMGTTSSGAAASAPQQLASNVNSTVLQVSTSTVDSYNTIGSGTTTPAAVNRVWAAGSYLTIASNATNTASCVAGVEYMPS